MSMIEGITGRTKETSTSVDSSDLISRQALCEYALNQKDKAITPNDIMRFPSADRPTGKWVKYEIPNGWYCNQCGSPIMTDDIKEMLFCPNCGAKMKGENK